MHHFGIPVYTPSMTVPTYDFDRIILGIPVQNCILGMLLTCPIWSLSKKELTFQPEMMKAICTFLTCS